MGALLRKALQFAALVLAASFAWTGYADQGGRIPLPLHQAGELLYEGSDFAIHALDRGPWNDDEHCSRSQVFELSVIFDVPDDFELSEAYVVDVLNEPLLRRLADTHCPAATSATSSIFLKDRVIGKDGRISDAQTVTMQGYEKYFLRLSINFGSQFGPSFRNNLRLSGNSWNDVIAFNARGLKTQGDVDAEDRVRAERARAVALEASRKQARLDWFAQQRAATRWPGRDNWMFEVYRLGHTGIPAGPIRTREDAESQKYPDRDDILLAYVERTHKLCGEVSPNGTTQVGFTLTNARTGLLEASERIFVDRQLEAAYTAAKLREGAYDVYRLNTIRRLGDEVEQLLGQWQCDGPEFGRFITGILRHD